MEGPPPEVIHREWRIILEIFRLNLFYYMEDCNLSVFNKVVVGSGQGDRPKYMGEGVASYGQWGEARRQDKPPGAI